MTEPKLLTEAEWRSILIQSVNYDTASSIIYNLRERGMTAPPPPEPEPVDPLLLEAREICASAVQAAQSSRAYHAGKWDETTTVKVALAALRRNKELAERPTLTREMVREAVEIAFSPTRWPVNYIDTMHAALVERLK